MIIMKHSTKRFYTIITGLLSTYMGLLVVAFIFTSSTYRSRWLDLLEFFGGKLSYLLLFLLVASSVSVYWFRRFAERLLDPARSTYALFYKTGICIFLCGFVLFYFACSVAYGEYDDFLSGFIPVLLVSLVPAIAANVVISFLGAIGVKLIRKSKSEREIIISNLAA